MSELDGTRTISIPSLAFNYVDNKLESVGYGGELYVRQRALESYSQVPEQGEHENGGECESHGTNWQNLFGTPERAARTISVTAKCFEPATACRECIYKDYCDTECDYGKLLEWLRGDA